MIKHKQSLQLALYARAIFKKIVLGLPGDNSLLLVFPVPVRRLGLRSTSVSSRMVVRWPWRWPLSPTLRQVSLTRTSRTEEEGRNIWKPNQTNFCFVVVRSLFCFVVCLIVCLIVCYFVLLFVCLSVCYLVCLFGVSKASFTYVFQKPSPVIGIIEKVSKDIQLPKNIHPCTSISQLSH